jgi:membrane-associated phospholipid phosphatase
MFDTNKLRPLDRLNILGMALISIVALVFHSRVSYYLSIIAANALVSVGIVLLANLDAKAHNPVIRFIAHWYSMPLIFLTFKELYLMVHPINPHDLDYVLIKMDKMIFGSDPTALLDKIATPGLTEFLQICYSSFYLLWFILGIDLLRQRNEEGFLFFLFLLMYGFYTSYAGYLLVPAIGPRFTLYDFARLDHDLPGLYVTPFLRSVINSGESITNVAKAALLAQRDCFPSGHTEMTLITIAAAIRYRAKSAMIIVPLGSGLIFATVYMRYHYGIDVIAGALLGAAVLANGRWLEGKMGGGSGRALSGDAYSGSQAGSGNAPGPRK